MINQANTPPQNLRQSPATMNSRQALTKLRKLLGPKAALQDLKRPSSPELRAAQRAERIRVNAIKQAASDALEARKAAILSADGEYQRLLREWRAARELQDRTPHGLYHRYEALTVGVFANVQAEADTLEELIEKVATKVADHKVMTL
jgi:hypothetical protein